VGWFGIAGGIRRARQGKTAVKFKIVLLQPLFSA
jgi:hypothetical protein